MIEIFKTYYKNTSGSKKMITMIKNAFIANTEKCCEKFYSQWISMQKWVLLIVKIPFHTNRNKHQYSLLS
jgi:hypothetical protein